MEKFEPSAGNSSRRDFLKKLGLATAGVILKPKEIFSNPEQINPTITKFIATDEKFKNGHFVYEVESNGDRVGEFWPIKGINLVTKDTDPEIFTGQIENIQQKLGGVATAPDGMTSASLGSYRMEGKALSNGRECGNGVVENYGIILVEDGFNITFTHKSEINDFDSFYEEAKNKKDTLFFLPSIYRNGNSLLSENKIDKVLIRREVPKSQDTPKGEQIGVIIFDKSVSCNDAIEIVSGLNRKGQSTTTHIYVLDGGPSWGQSAKEVNGKTVIMGKRDEKVVTNYLVFY